MPNVRDVIKNHITFAIERRPRIATVQAVHGGGYIDIYAKGMLRNVEVLGDVSVGDTVLLTWVKRPGALTEVPVAIAPGGAGPVAQVNIAVDNITIMNGKNGLAVKPGSIGLGHLNFVPALEGHEHVDTLRAGGWDVDDDGVLFNTDTRIAPDGSIILGRGDESLRLAGAHEEYRLWTGNVDPTLAPFSIKKDGSIEAIAGHIGGWLIGVDSLTSDDGNVGMSVADHEGGKWRFWAGGPPDSAPFRVNADGDVWLESAHIAADLQSQGFASGLRGWRLDRTGTLEAQNAIIRGTIRSVVFAYQEESVFGGAWGLYKGGGKLEAPVITDPENPFDIVVKGTTFAAGDILYIKDGITADNWLVVEAVQGDGETRTYTCSIVNGGSAATFEAGTTVINYGASGGFIRMYAEDGVAHLTVAKHSGQPWSPDPVLRIGDLYGYGTFGPNERGWAVGDPGGDNYAYYSDLDSKLVISGEIKAKSGSIGGWVIGDETIVGGGLTLDKDGFIKLSNGGNVAYMTANDGSWFMWAGNENPTNANFRVGVDGKMYATDADISGRVVASDGSLSGLSITGVLTIQEGGKLQANSVEINNTGLWIYSNEEDQSINRLTFFDTALNKSAGYIQVGYTSALDLYHMRMEAGYSFGIGTLPDSRITLTARTVEFSSVDAIATGNLSTRGWFTFSGSDAYLRTNNASGVWVLTAPGSGGAHAAQFLNTKGLRVSTSYTSGTIPDNGILFYTDTTFYRSASGVLRSSGALEATTHVAANGVGFYNNNGYFRVDNAISTHALRIQETGQTTKNVTITADSDNRLRVPNQYTAGNHWIGALLKNRIDSWVEGFIYRPHYHRAYSNQIMSAGDIYPSPATLGFPSNARPKAYIVRIIGYWVRPPNTVDRVYVMGWVDGQWRYMGAIYNYVEGFNGDSQFVVPANDNGQIRINFAGSDCNGFYLDCVGAYF